MFQLDVLSHFAGEYRSDEDAKSGQGMDDNSQQAVEAMLMMSNYSTAEPTSSTNKGMDCLFHLTEGQIT